MLKEQILEALKTKYKAYGLSNDALDRIASLREKTVEKAEDIEGAVADATTLDLIAKEIQRQRDQAIQKNSESQRAFEAYKAAHPEPDAGGAGDKDKDNGQDIASIVKAAVDEAVAPLNEKITALETSKSAEAALSTAHSSFFNGDYAKKYKDQATDAWERAVELNEATGNKMTAEELAAKASGYFNKAVSRLGVDTSKPFQADPPKNDEEGTIDWSAEVARKKAQGLIPDGK
jgi:hypothetical protein